MNRAWWIAVFIVISLVVMGVLTYKQKSTQTVRVSQESIDKLVEGLSEQKNLDKLAQDLNDISQKRLLDLIVASGYTVDKDKYPRPKLAVGRKALTPRASKTKKPLVTAFSSFTDIKDIKQQTDLLPIESVELDFRITTLDNSKIGKVVWSVKPTDVVSVQLSFKFSKPVDLRGKYFAVDVDTPSIFFSYVKEFEVVYKNPRDWSTEFVVFVPVLDAYELGMHDVYVLVNGRYVESASFMVKE